MTLAYLFPGQGAETPGMGRDFAANSLIFKQTIAAADAVLDFDLPAYLASDAPLLEHPDWLQPALTAYSVALYRAVSAVYGPGQVLCGLSLGEYGALIASGMLPLADGLRLVATRGRAMAKAASERSGGMIALRAPKSEDLAALTALPEVWVANANSPRQIVLGGSQEGLAAAKALMTERKVKGMPLPVAGAFHTPMMAAAQPALSHALQQTPVTMGQVPVISTTTLSAFTPETLRATLVDQLTSSTNFADTVLALQAQGVTEVIELSEKPILTKLVRQSAPDMTGRMAPSYTELEEKR